MMICKGVFDLFRVYTISIAQEIPSTTTSNKLIDWLDIIWGAPNIVSGM